VAEPERRAAEFASGKVKSTPAEKLLRKRGSSIMRQPKRLGRPECELVDAAVYSPPRLVQGSPSARDQPPRD